MQENNQIMTKTIVTWPLMLEVNVQYLRMSTFSLKTPKADFYADDSIKLNIVQLLVPTIN